MQEIETDIQQITGLKIDAAQHVAIKHSLTHCITLIQGCPGSGKTFTAAAILKGLSHIYNNTSRNKQILCCAGSNIAADNIALYCMKAKLSAIRVYSKSMEEGDFNKLPEI